MKRSRLAFGTAALLVLVLGLSMACAKDEQEEAPDTSPGPSPVNTAGAPALRAPVDGASISAFTALVLTVEDVAGAYSDTPVRYDFEIVGPAGGATTLNVPRSGNTTSHTVASRLDGNAPLTWRARAVFGSGAAGDWSASRTFSLRTNTFVEEPTLGDSMGTPIDVTRGPIQLRAGVQMQGVDFDAQTAARFTPPCLPQAMVAS